LAQRRTAWACCSAVTPVLGKQKTPHRVHVGDAGEVGRALDEVDLGEDRRVPLLLDGVLVVPALALAGPRQVARLLARRGGRVLGEGGGGEQLENEGKGERAETVSTHGGLRCRAA
jgi:hypothetical protein